MLSVYADFGCQPSVNLYLKSDINLINLLIFSQLDMNSHEAVRFWILSVYCG